MSVRKAHNSGRNHERNVLDYYQRMPPFIPSPPSLPPLFPVHSKSQTDSRVQKSAMKKLSRSSTPSRPHTQPKAKQGRIRCSHHKAVHLWAGRDSLPRRLDFPVCCYILLPILSYCKLCGQCANRTPSSQQECPHRPSCPAPAAPAVLHQASSPLQAVVACLLSLLSHLLVRQPAMVRLYPLCPVDCPFHRLEACRLIFRGFRRRRWVDRGTG